jgi:methyl-accepting chemotaxis protein
MFLLAKFKILTKILGIVVMLSSITAATGWLGVHALGSLNDGAENMSYETRRAIDAVLATQNVIAMNRGQFNVALDPSPKNRVGVRTNIDKDVILLHAQIDEIETTRDPRAKGMLPALRESLAIYEKSVADTFRLAEATDDGQSIEETAALRDAAMKGRAIELILRGKINAVADRLRDRVDHFATAASEEYGFTSKVLMINAVIGVLFGLGGGFVIGQYGICHPLLRLKAVMEAFARNDLSAEVPGAARGDELGDMARTVQIFGTNALEVDRLKREQQALARQTAELRHQDMRKLAGQFEAAVGKIVQTLSTSAEGMEMAAGKLTTTAETTEKLTTVVSLAAGTASTNVQSIAAATEEMTATVSEISHQVHDAAQMAKKATGQAQTTNQRVQALAEAARKIGDVVNLISAIAGQTNLLALNATIEAARAGEAGRGFAVVATEVKSLAEQTAKATAEIGEHISAIQMATEASVLDIDQITHTITALSEISTMIAAAVEQQGAATREIAHSVQQASQGTTQVATNIEDVKRGASDTGSASSQVLSAAKELTAESRQLDTAVRDFLSSVRAA